MYRQSSGVELTINRLWHVDQPVHVISLYVYGNFIGFDELGILSCRVATAERVMVHTENIFRLCTEVRHMQASWISLCAWVFCSRLA